jgi:hypothetical protein
MDSLKKYTILSTLFAAQNNVCDIEEWDSSDDEVEIIMHGCIKFPVVAIQHFYEYVVPRYSDKKFNKQFRISRELFHELTMEYSNTPEYQKLAVKPNVISPGKSIAIFLWYAGHQSGMPNVADRFHVSLSTVHEVVLRVIVFLSNQSAKVIQWPLVAEMMKNAEHHEKTSFIPGIIGTLCNQCELIIHDDIPNCLTVEVLLLFIGCIDGTHVIIDPPKKRKDDYINRKGSSHTPLVCCKMGVYESFIPDISFCVGHMSIHVQAICNRDRRFIHLFLGYPGRVHDSRVFRNSDVPEYLAKLPAGQGKLAHSCALYLRNVKERIALRSSCKFMNA